MFDKLDQMNGGEHGSVRIAEAREPEATRERVNLCVAHSEERAEGGGDTGRRRMRGSAKVDA